MKCRLCPHECEIPPNALGFCGARANINNAVVCVNYGRVTSIALDPIEKKPLARYKPGSRVLSVGSFGCNFRCPFCQNHSISMMNADSCGAGARVFSCRELVDTAAALIAQGNIGVAYTYNEPLVGYEFVYDAARLVKSRGMDNVVVTNGCIEGGRFQDLLPFIDAMNIDLKAFTDSFYQKIKGSLETVQTNIARAAPHCHLELTCLIIPGENDSRQEMEAMCDFIASVSPRIPLHLTRFFPCYKYAHKDATPVKTLESLKRIAQKKLDYVFVGNV